MKYGIIVSGKVTEPTDVPASGQADPVAWLTQYRWAAAWVPVSDDCVPGATYNGGGSSTNPPLPVASPVPVVRTRDEIIEALPAGVMKACRDSADAAVIKQFYKFLAKNGFTKNEGIALGTFLESKGIITAQQNVDFVAAWPTA